MTANDINDLIRVCFAVVVPKADPDRTCRFAINDINVVTTDMTGFVISLNVFVFQSKITLTTTKIAKATNSDHEVVVQSHLPKLGESKNLTASVDNVEVYNPALARFVREIRCGIDFNR